VYCVLGYYVAISVEKENQRREEAEFVAARERELRENAEKLARELKHLDSAKTQFLLSTQHHLRNPLSIIQGYLSLINDGTYGKIPARAKKKIDASLDAGRKLIQLVNDLLDIAHFQMGRGEVVKEPVDTLKMVAGIVDDLKPAADSKKIYLRYEKPAAPVAPININYHGVREAVYNIVDNAIKYTQEGGVTVLVKVAGKKLVISVADTGIGLSEKDLSGLFERVFERGEKAMNVNINGKGIGLYLAAQLIKSNGGSIRAGSAGWGKGATFIIELPIGGAQDPTTATPQSSKDTEG
jgi:signal transduction histidine kinase